MEKIYRNFHIKRWLECDTNGCRSKFQYNNQSFDDCTTIYPIYDNKIKMRKLKSEEIYSTDYISLMLNYYQAYEKCYRIKEIYVSMENVKTVQSKLMPKKWNELIQREVDRQNNYKSHQFNYDKMAMSLQRLEDTLKKISAKTPITRQVNNNDAEAKKLHFTGIMINEGITIQYRNDIRYFIKLKELIQNDYAQKYGDIFDEWIKVLDK